MIEQTSQIAAASTLAPRHARNSFKGQVIRFAQSGVTILVTRPLLWSSGGYTVTNSVTFNPDKRYLVLANHQSRWDPFVIFASLPTAATPTIGPIKFLTARSIYNTPLLPFLRLMGCYPTRDRISTVSESSLLVRRGYAVCMFPEGRRTLQSESNPREGVVKIIENLNGDTSYSLVLAHLEWTRKGFFNRHLTITFYEEDDTTRFVTADEIMKTIYRL